MQLFLPDGDFRFDAVGAGRGCLEGVLAVRGGGGDDEGGLADFQCSSAMRAPQAHGREGGGDVSRDAFDLFLGAGMRGVGEELHTPAGVVVAHDAVE